MTRKVKKHMTLKLDFAFLSPVQVVKVTTQNLEEVAEWCGGQVAKTESRRVPGREDSYVWVPTPKGTKISWAFPGMLITKRLVLTVKGEMRVTYAVFRRDYYEKNYFESPKDAVDQTWEKGMNTPNKPKKKHPDMAGKPKGLELNVAIPEGSTTEEVEEAVTEAVKVLEEQGVLHSANPEIVGTVDDNGIKVRPETVEDEALKAIANSEEFESFKQHEQTMSPAEVRNAQIEAVAQAEKTEEKADLQEQEANVEAQLAQSPVDPDITQG